MSWARVDGRLRSPTVKAGRDGCEFFRTKQPHPFTFLIALLLAIVGVASTRFQIEYVSAHAFWFVVAAYVVLALGTLIDGL
jgi:hypothetical protein